MPKEYRGGYRQTPIYLNKETADIVDFLKEREPNFNLSEICREALKEHYAKYNRSPEDTLKDNIEYRKKKIEMEHEELKKELETLERYKKNKENEQQRQEEAETNKENELRNRGIQRLKDLLEFRDKNHIISDDEKQMLLKEYDPSGCDMTTFLKEKGLMLKDMILIRTKEVAHAPQVK